jgi:hypothetical protein
LHAGGNIKLILLDAALFVLQPYPPQTNPDCLGGGGGGGKTKNERRGEKKQKKREGRMKRKDGRILNFAFPFFFSTPCLSLWSLSLSLSRLLFRPLSSHSLIGVHAPKRSAFNSDEARALETSPLVSKHTLGFALTVLAVLAACQNLLSEKCVFLFLRQTD